MGLIRESVLGKILPYNYNYSKLSHSVNSLLLIHIIVFFHIHFNLEK